MVEICCSAGSDRIFRFGGLYHVLPAQYLPLTLLIAAAVVGVFQLVLHIKNLPLKIILCILLAVGTAIGGYCGFVFFAFMQRDERKGEYNGVPCIVESVSGFGNGIDYYYEAHGPFLSGVDLLNVD